MRWSIIGVLVCLSVTCASPGQQSMDAAIPASGEPVLADGGSSKSAPTALAPRDSALLEVAGLFPPVGEALELEAQLRERGFDSHLGARDRGLGAQDLELFRYGSSVSCNAVLHSWSGLLTALTVTCSGPPHTVELRASMLGPDVRSTAAGLRVHYEWPEHRRRMERHRESVLGAAPPVDVDPELRRSFEVLRDEARVHGHSCGYGGGTPPGRTALEHLVEAGAVEALRHLLRAATPAGRAYAAEGLSRLDAVDAEDRRALQRLARTPVPSCDGCIHWDLPFGERLESALERARFDAMHPLTEEPHGYLAR